MDRKLSPPDLSPALRRVSVYARKVHKKLAKDG